MNRARISAFVHWRCIQRALATVLMLVICTVSTGRAQQLATLKVTVRDAAGTAVPLALVQVSGAVRDTAVRSNDNGVATLTVRVGTVHLLVNAIGYKPVERDVIIDRDVVTAEVALIKSAQALDKVNVRDNWIGIRGVVGDTNQITPLAGVAVHASNGDMKVMTDSAGHFAMRLDKAKPIVLHLDRKGYHSRTFYVDVTDGENPDVEILMVPGKEPNIVSMNLLDLGMRSHQTGFGSLLVSRDELWQGKDENVEEALFQSRFLAVKGLRLNTRVCVFQNGEPQPGIPLSAYFLRNIEFVEAYTAESDETGTLKSRWRKNSPCGPTIHGTRSGEMRYVVVWMRQ